MSSLPLSLCGALWMVQSSIAAYRGNQTLAALHAIASGAFWIAAAIARRERA